MCRISTVLPIAWIASTSAVKNVRRRQSEGALVLGGTWMQGVVRYGGIDGEGDGECFCMFVLL